MTAQRIRALDLFCGAGGSSFGAKMAGAEIVAGFDMWDLALKTYEANFPRAKVYQKDLQDLTVNEIKQITIYSTVTCLFANWYIVFTLRKM